MDIGFFKGVEHHIDTQNERPTAERMRRTPLGFQQEEKDHLQLMLDHGIISPSSSPWASAPVLVRKKDGRVRYCTDFRKLNDITIKDRFPLPLIEDCLSTLSGTKYFNTLDMTSAYWQIGIAPESRPKTAFITKYGLFEYNRLPFGLCNSPATFQRAVQQVLHGLLWDHVLVYLDDCVVLGPSFNDTMTHLRKVLARLRLANLKLKPKKCSLFQTSIVFLGKKVDSDGIALNPANISAVRDWPQPKTVKEVERFLGFANYHREHMAKYSDVAEPLYKLTGPRAIFDWKPEHAQSFVTIKEKMIAAPVLSYPNAKDPFILDVDASDIAIGAELIQVQDGIERVISYGSKILPSTERRYCTTRKELLALVLFLRQYRQYLLGRPVVVRTDHHSLTWLMRFKQPIGQLARWLEELGQYDLQILHRPGKRHTNADGLSRVPTSEPFCDCYNAGTVLENLPCGGCKFCRRAHSQWERFHMDVDDVIPLAYRGSVIPNKGVIGATRELPVAQIGVCAHVDTGLAVPAKPDASAPGDWMDGYTWAELRKKQLQDPDLYRLLDWKENSAPAEHELALESPAVKYFWSLKELLSVREGVLFYLPRAPLHHQVFMVPKQMQEEFISHHHDLRLAGHMGSERTIAKVKQSGIWHGLRQDCTDFVKTCERCNRNKKATNRPRARLGQFHAGSIMERIHMDILGPLNTTKSGNKYILLIVDQFSKWVECYALPDQTAESVAKKLVNDFIAHFGCPQAIHTDQGSNFQSKLFTEVCNLLGIAKTRTTPYRPCSNGQCERMNRTILQIIRCLKEEGSYEWDEHLGQVGAALRASINASTGETPNRIFLGRETSLPVDVMLGPTEEEGERPIEYAKKLKAIMQVIHSQARTSLQTAQRRQKSRYDRHLTEHTYDRGDVVYMLNSATQIGKPKKLAPVYKGPYVVMEVLSPVLLQVRDRKKQKVVHHDRIKPCHDRQLPRWLARLRHDLLKEGVESEDELDDGEVELGDSLDIFREPEAPIKALGLPDTSVEETDVVLRSRRGRQIRVPDRLDL